MVARKPGPTGFTDEALLARIEVINEFMEQGFPLKASGGVKTAIGETARALGLTPKAVNDAVQRAAERGIYPDETRYHKRTPFTVDDLPHDGEPTAEELIGHLKAKFVQRQAHEEAKKLIDVRVVGQFENPQARRPGVDFRYGGPGQHGALAGGTPPLGRVAGEPPL